MIRNSLFLQVLESREERSLSRPPVWFMRQAGRALASYRALKEKHTFAELLRDPKRAAQVTLLPRDALGVDALILFSDILVIPEALGVGVDYEQGGPRMLQPLKTTGGVLPKKGDPEILESVYRTIQVIKDQEKDIPLIGFCGGPLTVFLYLYQGSGHGGNFDEAMDFFYNHPQETDRILETVTEMSIRYAQGQIDQGVDAFQIFETWANVIPAAVYVERVLPLVVKMAAVIRASVPVIYFPRFFSNGYELLLPYAEFFSGIGIDYLMDMNLLHKRLPEEIVLQGNIDPTWVKHASPGKLQTYLDEYLKFFQKRKRWIVNLGHGVLPGTPEANLKLIVDRVKSLNPSP